MLIVFISCSKKETKNSDDNRQEKRVKIEKQKNHLNKHKSFNTSCENFNLVLDGSISFALDSMTTPFSRFLKSFKIEGTRYLIFEQNNTVYFYNIDNQIKELKIHYQKEGPDGVGNNITAVHPINFDSIYLVSQDHKIIYLTDKNAKVIKKHYIELKYSGIVSRPVFSHGTFINNPLILHENRFYLNINPFPGYTTRNKSELKKEKVALCFDRLKDSSSLRPFSFDVICDQNNKPYSTAFNRIYANGMFFFNFFGNHEIYVLDIDLKEYDSFKIKSKYIEDIINPSTTDDFRKTMKETLASKHYDNLHFDKFRNVFYRFVYLGTELKPNEHPFTAGKNPTKFSIIVFDNEFNILLEKLMPANTYNYKMCFIEREGLYISKNHIKNKDFTEDQLEFGLFKLVELNGKENPNI